LNGLLTVTNSIASDHDSCILFRIVEQDTG
jgi:hypothetical protein